MVAISSAVAAALFAAVAAGSPLEKRATIAQTFVPPSTSPLNQTSNYPGYSNGSLPARPVVPGKAFDRIIHIWLENTDYESAATTSAMQALQPQGVLLDQFYGVTHPSEPNYLAAVTGDFFGMSDDSFYHLPTNVTTLFDLMDAGDSSGKPISYACYQENMPYSGFTAFNYTQKNYISPSSADYVYYVRKHNPCAISDYVSSNKTRAQLTNRNFNDLAVDVGNNTLPEWMFITPNLVNDGHDTTAAFFSNWTQYFMTPMLKDTRFNNNRTLILLTFDENESYTAPNRIYTLALGGAVPSALRNTTDSTYLTHYSGLSTVEANWGLGNLGRGDVNKTMANVLPFFASALNYTNMDVDAASIPQTNITGVAPGPYSLTRNTLFYAPDSVNVTGAGGRPVLVKSGLNTTQTLASLPQTNLTAMGQKNVWSTDPAYNNTPSNTSSASTTTTSHAPNGASVAAVPSLALLAVGSLAVLLL